MNRPKETMSPGFLCIGAARSGTSWLHTNLMWHPDLSISPLKELHYFDAQRRGASHYYPIPEVNAYRLGWSWYWNHYRALRYLLVRSSVSPAWAARYLFGWRSDRWYSSLFSKERLSGELTPGYMLLPRPVVEDVRALNPDMKIILMLRDPVLRAWSQLRHTLGDRFSETPEAEIREQLVSPDIVLRNGYMSAIETWRGVFGEDQVYIGFHDEIATSPFDLLNRILSFLGVESVDPVAEEGSRRIVNAAPKHEIPESIERHLYGTYRESLEELTRVLGPSPADAWLARAKDRASLDPLFPR